MNFLGVDPDLRTTALAWVNSTRQVVWLDVIQAGKAREQVLEMIGTLKCYLPTPVGYDVCAVEAQELYLGTDTNPRDILHLAQVAGACVSLFYISNNYFPRPSEWKGQQDKEAHHKKILTKCGCTDFRIMGGKDPYCVPNHPEFFPNGASFNDSDWKHLNDAIGLAQYAAERYSYETTKARMLTEARLK
jgi:hypothetical protein